MDEDPSKRPVSVLHGLWLSVFVVDASLVGRGWDHRVGALLFLVFFGALLFGELRQSRDKGTRHYGDPDS